MCVSAYEVFRHRVDELIVPGSVRTVWQEWDSLCRTSCDFLHPSLDTSAVLSFTKQISSIADTHKKFVSADDLAIVVLESLKFAVPLRTLEKSERQSPWLLKGCDRK